MVSRKLAADEERSAEVESVCPVADDGEKSAEVESVCPVTVVGFLDTASTLVQ
jgi:hypothetical protein